MKSKRGRRRYLLFVHDGVSGLESEAKAIFKDVVVQRCMVHLIRNSVKYVPSKNYKGFMGQLKKVNGAPSVKVARAEIEKLKQTWSGYFAHVDQLYDYGSVVRKIMYTTYTDKKTIPTFPGIPLHTDTFEKMSA